MSQDTAPVESLTAPVDSRNLGVRALRTPQGVTGALMLLLVCAVVVFGPLLAPHGSADFVGPPYQPPSGKAWLGTDYQGHDVLSMLLRGGPLILGVAGGSAAISILVALVIGLAAGASTGRLGRMTMRTVDFVLIFPPLIVALLVLTRAGSSMWLLIVVTVVTQIPSSARVFWAAARSVSGDDYVESARTIGLSHFQLVRTEIAPNMVAPLLVEIPIRFIYCIAIVSTLAFLGFGEAPPGIDWATMINQGKGALTLQPWPVVAPVICIAMLAVGANLLADAIRRQADGQGGES